MSEQTERRGAVIVLGEEHIAHLLSLPDGWRVEAVRDDFLRNAILVRVSGPDAPTWAEATVPVELQFGWHFEPPSAARLELDPMASGTVHIVLPDYPAGPA